MGRWAISKNVRVQWDLHVDDPNSLPDVVSVPDWILLDAEITADPTIVSNWLTDHYDALVLDWTPLRTPQRPIDWTPYPHTDALDTRPTDMTFPEEWEKGAASHQFSEDEQGDFPLPKSWGRKTAWKFRRRQEEDQSHKPEPYRTPKNIDQSRGIPYADTWDGVTPMRWSYDRTKGLFIWPQKKGYHIMWQMEQGLDDDREGSTYAGGVFDPYELSEYHAADASLAEEGAQQVRQWITSQGHPLPKNETIGMAIGKYGHRRTADAPKYKVNDQVFVPEYNEVGVVLNTHQWDDGTWAYEVETYEPVGNESFAAVQIWCNEQELDEGARRMDQPSDLILPWDEAEQDYYRHAVKVAASFPANYTPEDPLDLAGKQPLFQSMESDWASLPPDQGKRAVVNAFRATMLSPRMNLKGNAVLYQLLMNVDPSESNPDVFEQIIRDMKQQWDAQGQTDIFSDPSEQEDPNQFLPGRLQPGIWTNIRRLANLGPYADRLYQAAMDDYQEGATGELFRDRVLKMGIPGVGTKVTSFAWLALAPTTSELGTIDVHMMRHLNQDDDAPKTHQKYLELENQLRQERNDLYPGVPLTQYQWGVWDKRRTPGFHQDHTSLRPVDPTPYTDVEWERPVRSPRPQNLDIDPNQLGFQFGKWKLAEVFQEYNRGDRIRNVWSQDTGTVDHRDRQGYWINWDDGDYSPVEAKDLEPLDPRERQPIVPDHPPSTWSKVLGKRWELYRLGGYSLQGEIVTKVGQGTTSGIAIMPEQQSKEEILYMLDQLPTHNEDYQKQRQMIPEWAINRGGKVADFRPTPDFTGVTYAPGAIIVSQHVDVDDNWILYHDACTGIIAGIGGEASHGVVVARERNIPIVVNLNGWDKIRPGDQLTINSATGRVDVNGGNLEEFGDTQQALHPTVAFVWSQGQGLSLPIPPGSGGAANLHRQMIRQLKQQGTFNKLDVAIGVIYEDGHVQIKGKPSDRDQMEQWLNSIQGTTTTV